MAKVSLPRADILTTRIESSLHGLTVTVRMKNGRKYPVVLPAKAKAELNLLFGLSPEKTT